MNDINNIDLNLLKSLYALLAECHVGRAANRMHVTQPALDLFEDLSQTLSDINELIAPKVFDPALANGKFTINTHDFVATSYLPPRIKEIQRLAPKLNFDIQTLTVTTQHGYPLDSLHIIRGRKLVNKRCFYANLSTAIN